MPDLEPDSGALQAQLIRLIETRLLDPLEILLEVPLAELHSSVRERAEHWCRQLLEADDRDATQLVVRLIAALYPGDAPFDPPAEWWKTPLGQVVVRRVGHPTAHTVSYSVAGAMLGITRQGVHDLVVRDKLAKHPDGGVTVASIRERARRLAAA